MEKYSWAVNPLKLQRAIADGGDEEAIKARYIALGGLVNEPVKEVINAPLDESTPDVSVEAPKVKETKSTKQTSDSK